jgi:recombination protein RecT
MQPLATVEDAKNYMLASFKQFDSIVGSVEKAKRFFAIGLHCIEQVPRILDCPRSSFRNALLEAARLDLEPNSVQQFAWIIPRAQKKGARPVARLEIGYRGLIQLVRRDGGVKDIWATAIDDADEFRRTEGTVRGIVHKQANPLRDGTVATMVGAYACALLHNDVTTYKVMDREELDAARALSRSSAYEGDFAMEMYLKTPIKRLCKTLPLKAPDVAQAVALEDLHENIVPDPMEIQVETVARQEAMEVEAAVAEEEVEKVELPEETREEINVRIRENFKLLIEIGAEPLLSRPMIYYVRDAKDGEAREFADYLSREVLKAERANR